MRSGPRKNSDAKETAAADALLRSAGLRRTPVRMGVLALLAGDPHPLSAQQIIDKLPPGTDAVTVYRSLTTLTRKGLLHRIHGDDRVWRFAMDSAPARSSQPSHEHAHFVCDDCGTVECFSEVPLPRSISKDLKLGKGYDVSYSEVLLHGTCPRCPKR
jgi:Fur family ferric uptake transcriptional regulator